MKMYFSLESPPAPLFVAQERVRGGVPGVHRGLRGGRAVLLHHHGGDGRGRGVVGSVQQSCLSSQFEFQFAATIEHSGKYTISS